MTVFQSLIFSEIFNFFRFIILHFFYEAFICLIFNFYAVIDLDIDRKEGLPIKAMLGIVGLFLSYL
jgi:hypothetical protein